MDHSGGKLKSTGQLLRAVGGNQTLSYPMTLLCKFVTSDPHGDHGVPHVLDDISSGSFIEDEGIQEAAWTHGYTHKMFEFLCRPEVYTSFGLLEPPSSFMPPDIEMYAKNLRWIDLSAHRREESTKVDSVS